MEQATELREGEHLLFVFGSLMKGLSNHRFLMDATYAGDAKLKGYEMYSNGYIPHVVPSEKKGRGVVVGETYIIDNPTLARVDRLEGYVPGAPYSFYDRQEVTLEDGRKAYAYVSPATTRTFPENKWPSGKKFQQPKRR